MKLEIPCRCFRIFVVTSYAEVWIEMVSVLEDKSIQKVTSYAEVWIEIGINSQAGNANSVTSYAEVWIEIAIVCAESLIAICHLLRGGVD